MFFTSFLNNHNGYVCASWALHNFLSVGIRLETATLISCSTLTFCFETGKQGGIV